MKKRIKLVQKLFISYIIATLIIAVVNMILPMFMLNDRFNNYVGGVHKNRMSKIVDTVRKSYNNSNFYELKYELSAFAKLEGIYIKLQDIDGKVIFDTGKEYLFEKKENMNSLIEERKLEKKDFQYNEKLYNLSKKDTKTGTITIGYYGVNNRTNKELDFLDKMKLVFILVIVLSISISLIISFILSKQISIPINMITKTANKIRRGILDTRTSIISNTEEIYELSTSINYLAQTLENEDMLRKRLTSDMAHEIRTPLTTLQNYMEAFIDGVWEPTEERIQSCYDEIIRLNRLVQNLKNIAKLEQENLCYNKTRFNICEEINNILEFFKPQFTKKDIELILECKTDIIVETDRDKIKQIIGNLLSNAYRYTDSGGKVEVGISNADGEIIIKVKDNGIGISKEDLPFIFERFYRADTSRSRETGGAGIGLTITKALVEACGGTIQLESEINKGSIFTVILPV